MSIQGIVAKKIGMTQIIQDDGSVEGVTALQAGPCTVTELRTEERHGYSAVQLGFEEIGDVNIREGLGVKRAVKRDEVAPLTFPEVGHFKRAGKMFRYIKEVPATELGELQIGQKVDVSMFAAGDTIHVVGTSKGRGFAGVVKRHGFHGGPKTHGQSDRHRAPGSVGSTTYAGRVFKGLRMAGHMGDVRVTTRNLKVVRVDVERNLLFVHGAVPGASNGIVLVHKGASATEEKK
ncbi:MAG: 50S ribosomal protein L3 [Dehalococcoidia bacterium]|nr:50S ribosomal protein L3 [Dehalococcoidia bacterium]